jgi:hypothetical protein
VRQCGQEERRVAWNEARRSAMQQASRFDVIDRHDSPSVNSTACCLLGGIIERSRRYSSSRSEYIDVGCDSMSLTRCDVIIRRFRCCVANHCLMNPADLCGHVRQQVRASTFTSTHIQFRTWEGLVRVYWASFWEFMVFPVDKTCKVLGR